MVNRVRRRLFGEILVSEGLISKEQLEEALEFQRSSGDFLGAILQDKGVISESDIVRVLSLQYQIPYIRPSLYDIDRKLLKKFPGEFLHLHKILPIDQIGNQLILVVTDIPHESAVEEVQRLSELNLAIYLTSLAEVDKILKQEFPLSETAELELKKQRREALAGGVTKSSEAKVESPALAATATVTLKPPVQKGPPAQKGSGTQKASPTPKASPAAAASAEAKSPGAAKTQAKPAVKPAPVAASADDDDGEIKDGGQITLDTSWEAIFDAAEGKVQGQ